MEGTVNVPKAVLDELTQLLANLVLGDNDIRSNAEKVVNDRLTQAPELYALAIANFTTSAPDDHMRAFALVLLRRLLFRPPSILSESLSSPSSPSTTGPRMTLYDRLSEQTRESLERAILYALTSEPSHTVKIKAADCVTDIANASFQRARPWPMLQETVFRSVGGTPSARECAYRILERCHLLVAEAPVEVFVRGLADSSVEVRLAALKASVSALSLSSPQSPSTAHATLLGRALATLPASPSSHTTRFLNAITPLASSHPMLFTPHMHDLLRFLPTLVLSTKEYDPEPTPTVSRPFPNVGAGAFQFPPLSVPKEDNKDIGEYDQEREETRRAALELMVSLSEARPSLARRVEGWLASIVRACLEGVAELPDTESSLEDWLDAEPTDDPTDVDYPHIFEQALDRLACACAGKPVLSLAFQYIPGMLASPDWRLRHGALMAIAALAEGGARVMEAELEKIVSLITNAFRDSHPRVRYAACQCIGQLCTDLEEVIQPEHHALIFSALIPTLSASEPRVHAHAAAAFINVCEGVAHDTLLPFLDPLVSSLLHLLEPQLGRNGRVKSYVQEQAVTTLAMVADASEGAFSRHYSSIMPLLMNVLRNANGGLEHRKLRWKAMECAGLVAIAVGRDVFRSDSAEFIQLLMRIQNCPIDPEDHMLTHYLIATWAKICQALGFEFEPYLPVVMPPLLHAANARADVSIWDENGEDDDGGDKRLADREGWETMSLDGQQVGIKTSALEEKCQAFETLVIYVSTLGARFSPYLSQTLDLAISGLKFRFHEGVREACAMIIPMLLVCGRQSGTLTPQMLNAVFAQLTNVTRIESDASFITSLFKCLADCTRIIGGTAAANDSLSSMRSSVPADVLPQELRDGIISTIRHQLQSIADKRKSRISRYRDAGNGDLPDDDERGDIALLEEIEGYALEEAARLLKLFDPGHQLLFAVSSIRDLGICLDE